MTHTLEELADAEHIASAYTILHRISTTYDMGTEVERAVAGMGADHLFDTINWGAHEGKSGTLMAALKQIQSTPGWTGAPGGQPIRTEVSEYHGA